MYKYYYVIELSLLKVVALLNEYLLGLCDVKIIQYNYFEPCSVNTHLSYIVTFKIIAHKKNKLAYTNI